MRMWVAVRSLVEILNVIRVLRIVEIYLATSDIHATVTNTAWCTESFADLS